jgi:D-arabinose 1-dehydrogenase-like Zn-dependent alcohol dehydrogenase
MRAAVLTAFNQPWALRTLPDPKPKAGQVVIRIRASGMCGTDLHAHHGILPLKLPIVCGHEPVGEVVEVGPGVTTVRAGDVVGVSWFQKGEGRCRFCQEGRPNFCQEPQSWMQLGGGNSELMLAWEGGCTLVPQGVSPEDAAPIFCAGYTVASGLRAANPRPGDRVAVLGIGGLGHIAIQYAKALGFEVVAVTGTEGKRAEAKEFGADSVVVAGSHAGKALKDAGGADEILSTSNSAAQLEQSISGLRPEGRLVALGLPDRPTTFHAMELMFPPRSFLGATQGARRDLIEALDFVAQGKIKPRNEVYPLEKVNEVRDRLEAGKVRYRAVLQHA